MWRNRYKRKCAVGSNGLCRVARKYGEPNLSTVRKDWVLASTFFAVRQRDGLIVGMIDIRHNLNNEFLSQYGGHIDYSVRLSERRKGYATEMLRQTLIYASQLGLHKVMLGCYYSAKSGNGVILALSVTDC